MPFHETNWKINGFRPDRDPMVSFHNYWLECLTLWQDLSSPQILYSGQGFKMCLKLTECL